MTDTLNVNCHFITKWQDSLKNSSIIWHGRFFVAGLFEVILFYKLDSGRFDMITSIFSAA